MDTCYIETPLGHAKITGDHNGITSVSVLDKPHQLSEIIPESLLDCVTQLKAYFKNDRKTFNLKLNPEGTSFQKKVWKQLETIPYSKTISYLDLAKQLGDPKVIRAAASANGKNPLWIIVPCHRVIGSDGSLTGYAGGLYRKQWLINHESDYKQQTLFLMYKSGTALLKRYFKVSTIYKHGFNWSPMYRRTTAKLVEVSDDLHYVKIRLKLNWKNRNYAGSLFGGSMLAATDPIYMIQLIQILGDNYVVWDKAVEARYKRPAKSTVYGEFIFTKEEIETIKQKINDNHQTDIVKTMNLVDEKQNIIATFNKTLYIADKRFYKDKVKKRVANNK